MALSPDAAKRKLNQSHAVNEIIGNLIGLLSAGIVLLLDEHLGSPLVYILSLAALCLFRYGAALVYILEVSLLCTVGPYRDCLDEDTLLKDHRMVNARTATAATCLAAAVAFTSQDPSMWIAQSWVVALVCAVIGGTTNVSLLFFTPEIFYIRIFGRFPRKKER